MRYHFKKNIRVYVKMKDGSSFTAKWHDSIRKHFRFFDREPVRIGKVRFIAINKPRKAAIKLCE